MLMRAHLSKLPRRQRIGRRHSQARAAGCRLDGMNDLRL